MLTFATVILPANSSASSSSAGAIILQGPHHSAQKSTSTGPGAPSTSVAKLVSVTGLVFALIAGLVVADRAGMARGRWLGGRRPCGAAREWQEPAFGRWGGAAGGSSRRGIKQQGD